MVSIIIYNKVLSVIKIMKSVMIKKYSGLFFGSPVNSITIMRSKVCEAQCSTDPNSGSVAKRCG